MPARAPRTVSTSGSSGIRPAYVGLAGRLECLEHDRPGRGGSSASSYAARTSAAATSADPWSRACTSASGSPASTASPRFARQTMPTAWSTGSSLPRRPAPRRSAASPTGSAARRRNVARARCGDLADDRCDRQRGLGRVATLRADPPLVRSGRGAVGERVARRAGARFGVVHRRDPTARAGAPRRRRRVR